MYSGSDLDLCGKENAERDAVKASYIVPKDQDAQGNNIVTLRLAAYWASPRRQGPRKLNKTWITVRMEGHNLLIGTHTMKRLQVDFLEIDR